MTILTLFAQIIGLLIRLDDCALDQLLEFLEEAAEPERLEAAA